MSFSSYAERRRQYRKDEHRNQPEEAQLLEDLKTELERVSMGQTRQQKGKKKRKKKKASTPSDPSSQTA